MISETNERADESPERHDEVTTEKAVEPSPKAEDSSETSNVDSERIEPKSESMLLDKPSESTKPAGTDASLDMIEPASIEEAQQPLFRRRLSVTSRTGRDGTPKQRQIGENKGDQRNERASGRVARATR